MNKQRFRITWEVITQKSSENGEAARSGFLPRSSEIPARSYSPKNPYRFTLAEAFEIVNRYNSGHTPIEADSCPCTVPRWLTARGETDANPGIRDALGVSLHLGDISPSSARRVARLFKTYGLTAKF